MSGPDAVGSFNIVIEPHSDQYDPDDDRWRDQVATLYRELRAEVDVVAQERQVPDAKGVAEHLAVALSSASALQAAASCFRAWLARDRDRRIEVKWDTNGVARSVTLTGATADGATINEISRAAADQVGGPPWPAGTGHS
jgi:hypothetical protein